MNKIHTIHHTDPLVYVGWTQLHLGYTRSNGKIVPRTGFKLYTRRRRLTEYIDDQRNKSSSGAPANTHNQGGPSLGSIPAMGMQKSQMTPSYVVNNTMFSGLPSLSHLTDYESLRALREDRPCLLIGYDSEWESAPVRTDMISWQFGMVHDGMLIEYLFIRDGADNLSLSDALGYILDDLNVYHPVDIRSLKRYVYCSSFKNGEPVETTTSNLDEARLNSRYVYRPGQGFTDELIKAMPDKSDPRDKRDWAWFRITYDYSCVEAVPVTIVCHFGRVDLSALTYGKKKVMKYLSEIHGGLVSMRPIRYAPRSIKKFNNTYVYPILLSVSDTMCHAPTGKQKLSDLGKVIGVEKVDIPLSDKQNMRGLLGRDPVLFAEYASTDSIVTLLYASALYGYNNALPVTMISAGARLMKEMMMSYLACESDEEFNREYRGLMKVRHGKVAREDRAGFIEASSMEPISDDANTIQYYASQAYHGGYNICTEVGYFPYVTYDYDLQNAYPTAMCLVPDINWDAPIRNEIIRRNLALTDFVDNGTVNPLTPFVGYVQFEFPRSVKYPCIPINVEGVPTYPLSSDGLDGVYVAGPFIWLALELGARVFCKRGYFLSVKLQSDGRSESRSLSSVVIQLVQDRAKAKKICGKGSLEELSLKEINNAGYGKVAQNVIDKSTWSAYKNEMEQLGCSAITNPVAAMMITSIVQVELIAAQNQIYGLGYMSCSVTTDGFISNCPEDILKCLDLYGLRSYMGVARLYLTDGRDAEIWEIKHAQDDLINFTTRGNVSLHCFGFDDNGKIIGNPMMINGKPYPGVCAHNSTKSGYPSDSYEDRYWLMTQVLSRTGTVDYTKNDLTSFKELVNDEPLAEIPRTRHIRMDFDMKRKPVPESFKTDRVSVDGTSYEIAHFDTEPYGTVDEFKTYRNKKELTRVLRTEADWDVFWAKLATKDTKAKPRDMDWSILNSCIMGHRAGDWTILGLEGKSVEEKCDWINAHNNSRRKYKKSDWKNARRPERQVNRLPYDLIKDKLDELLNAK